MKIKGLLLGMLAYAAMVACTNEDIVKNNVFYIKLITRS